MSDGDTTRVQVTLTPEEYEKLKEYRNEKEKQDQHMHRAEKYLGHVPEAVWFRMDAAKNGQPIFCGRHRCPDCIREAQSVRIKGTLVHPSELDRITEEWKDRGIIV